MTNGRKVDCQHSNYDGPERRQKERREPCNLHSGLEKSYEDLKTLHERTYKKVDSLGYSIESKVPMKLFYVMIGLIVAILGFQWTTYERVNKIALDSQKASSDLKLSIEQISSEVGSHQEINKIKLENLTKAVDNHQKSADKEIADIKSGIKEVKKEIEEAKSRINKN